VSTVAVRKPGSVGTEVPDGHSSEQSVTGRFKQPYPGASDGQPAPCSVLLRVGFTDCRVTPAARGLLHRGFTLTPPPRSGAVYFLWHFPWGCPRRALPGTLPCGARTFLPRGRERPSGPPRSTPKD